MYGPRSLWPSSYLLNDDSGEEREEAFQKTLRSTKRGSIKVLLAGSLPGYELAEILATKEIEPEVLDWLQLPESPTGPMGATAT